MSEGRVYICEWNDSGGQIAVQVRGRGLISANYATWDELHERFWQVIMEHTGDGEPVLVFSPPLPTAAADEVFLRLNLSMVSGAAYSGSKTNPADLFELGRCAFCGYVRGARNSRSANFYVLDGQACQSPQEWWFQAHGLYISDRFLEALHEPERACFDCIPIDRPPKSRRRYFEIAPKSFVPLVAIRGRPHKGGWRCPECHRFALDQLTEGSEIWDFIAAGDIPDPLPPVFAVGDAGVFNLVLPAERVAALLALPGTLGLHVKPLGVLPENLVDRAPLLLPPPRARTRS